MDWFEILKMSIEKVFSDWEKMSDEEFHAELETELEKHKSVDCNPDTCNGECQGMGKCEICTEFRNAIAPKIMNRPHKLGCKCKICTATLDLK